MKNKRVKIKKTEVLSDNWYLLNKVTFEYLRNDGVWQTQIRESYERGSGASVFLYNKQTQHIILVRQFRLPSYLNGNSSGLLVETCAGLLDKDDPETCIKKEILEETGYQVKNVTKVFEAYLSPGAVTENLHCFVAEYTDAMKKQDGGGLATEQEDIEVLEIPFQKAISWLHSGKIKDAKTIMLLQYALLHNLMEKEPDL